MTEMLFHYCVVRDDLEKGLLAAMLVHAAGESGPAAEGTHAVALQAPPRDLWLLWEGLCAQKESCVPVFEVDGEFAGQLMAIGFSPAPRDQRRSLQRFPLVR